MYSEKYRFTKNIDPLKNNLNIASKNQYPEITGEWALFLDRDGVINRKIDGDYVKTPEEFEILPNVGEALGILSTMFGRIVIVTNQQGVGKELMTHNDLSKVHNKMIDQLSYDGAHIDEIYYCPDLDYEDSPNRKPNPGMAYRAKGDFPEIDFQKSIMVGDSSSDIEFGNKLNMITVRISNIIDPLATFTHISLHDFCTYIK